MSELVIDDELAAKLGETVGTVEAAPATAGSWARSPRPRRPTTWLA